MTASLHRIHFTASEEFVRTLQEAKDALARRFPDGNLESILRAGLELLLQTAAQKPKAGVSQAVKREVQTRDERRCQWPLLTGGVCGATRFLEFDHITPRARGGDGSVDNLRILCRRHNLQAAREAFGKGWMGQFARGSGNARQV